MEKFKLFRTFNGDLAPKSTRFAYSFISTFRDALLQFVSLFLLLYVQFASPLGKENVSTYENMYLIITIGVALIKIISGLLAPFTSFLIEKSNPLFLAGDCLLWEKCSTEKISPCLLFCAAIHCCCIVAKKFGTNLAKSSE